MEQIKIKNKKYLLPDFFPDATRGVIRSVDSEDLKNVGVNGLVVNTYHLLSQPDTEILDTIGGIKNFMDWDGLIISDSGGFQMFSLVQKYKSGVINENGVVFNIDTKGGKKKYEITPEKCIQIQFSINPDIMIALDYFTPFGGTDDEIKLSVDLTTEWGARCKAEFDKQCEARGLDDYTRPLLFGVVQGAHDYKERLRSITELEEIGFDGYGLGGWNFTEDGKRDMESIRYIASIMPNDKPKYALGAGDPYGVVDSVFAGYDIFDCVLPTRDARHKRLYNFNRNTDDIDLRTERDWLEYLYINKTRYSDDSGPISEHCDCYTCKRYSRAYINHLFVIQDSLAFRLATMHNLRMYSKLMEMLRGLG